MEPIVREVCCGHFPSSRKGTPYASVDQDHKTRLKYYHGTLSWEESAKLLPDQASGTFLIRKSETRKGDYSLDVNHNGQVKSFSIEQKSLKDYHIRDKVEHFKSVKKLVQHYTKYPLKVQGGEKPDETEVVLKTPYLRTRSLQSK